jgi:hypothetical protein
VSTGTQFVTVANRVLAFNARAQLTSTVPFGPTIKASSISGDALGILPNGTLITASGDGVLVANLSGGTAVDMRFPRVTCPNRADESIPPLPPGVPTFTPYPAGYLCAQAPLLLASDGAGDVWMTLGNSSEIDVLEGVGAR